MVRFCLGFATTQLIRFSWFMYFHLEVFKRFSTNMLFQPEICDKCCWCKIWIYNF